MRDGNRPKPTAKDAARTRSVARCGRARVVNAYMARPTPLMRSASQAERLKVKKSAALSIASAERRTRREAVLGHKRAVTMMPATRNPPKTFGCENAP